MDLPDTVRAKLEGLPTRPGCYLFRGPSTNDGSPGEVLYVGKAKSLRSRVRSYFQDGSDDRYFLPLLRAVVADLETVVTATEKEAAILENSLIKQHLPRWNVKLRDDKEFLSLRLRVDHAWPRLDVVRKPADDGARYFGPYHSATAARRSLNLVNKHFQLRTCSDAELGSRTRPCLQHQIKRCPAPCVFDVDGDWYAEQVRAVSLFLSGRHDELTRKLRERMAQAARTLEFELAAIYRDQLRAVDELRAEQRVVPTGASAHVSQDVVGVHRAEGKAEVVVLYVRSGRVSETASFEIAGRVDGATADADEGEIISAFLSQHYASAADGGAEPPDEVLLPAPTEAMAGVAELLSERRGQKVELLVPRRGPRAHLVAMAVDNARHALEQRRRARDDVESRLEELRVRLRLPTRPRRIECCDISHLGGEDTVGAVVATLDGVPDKKHYRGFHVRGVRDGDDYGAMYEVLARRFRRGRDASANASESESVDWNLPDLFVVDGGRGQLAVALAAARDLGLHDLPVVAIAKEKTLERGDEVVDRVYLPGQKNPIPVRDHPAAMVILSRARDEAHRFANALRERLGKKRRMRSAIDELAGIGPALRKELVRRLGTVAAVRAADDTTLLSVPGFTKRHLTALRKGSGGAPS